MTTEHATGPHRANDVPEARKQPKRPSRFTTLKRAWTAAREDRLPLLAAGVAFFAFLSIIPTLIAAVLVYGIVSDPAEVTDQVERYAAALPSSAQALLTDQMATLAESSRQSLSIGLVIALLVALWSASNGTANMIMAVNLAYGGDLERGFVKRKALALVFTLGAIVFVVLTVALVAAAPAVLNTLDLPGWASILLQIARWILVLLAVVTALAVLYRIAPEHGPKRWQWLSFGAVVATLIWVIVSVGFSVYVDNFGNYAATYGSLAGIVVLLLWLWISAYAALFGAEINATGEQRETDVTT